MQVEVSDNRLVEHFSPKCELRGGDCVEEVADCRWTLSSIRTYMGEASEEEPASGENCRLPHGAGQLSSSGRLVRL